MIVRYVLLLLLLISPLCRPYFSNIATHLKTGKCAIARAVQLYDNNLSDDHSITYWHVHTDSKGMSTQKRQCIKMRELPFLESAPALLVSDSIVLQSSKVKFLKLLPGSIIDWHENPVKQWIVPLSGRWFVETMDHLRVEMRAGELSLGADLNTIPTPDGKMGHRSGAVGDEPAVLMLVQFD